MLSTLSLRASPIPRLLAAVTLTCVASMAGAAALAAAVELDATTSDPRAFGYQIGDLVSRTVTVEAPDGLSLDETSVPQPGARGNALELRSVARSGGGFAGGRRLAFTLAYQVFLSPPQPRTLEMPGFTLRFKGEPREQEVRIEAWPVTVSPLVPEDVSPRRGLGELQPDAAPPLIDTRPGRLRLVAYGCAALVLLAWLFHVHVGLPWWARAHRPFTQAWRALRGLTPSSPAPQQRAAFQQLHDALNRTMGEVVFEQGVDRFVSARPRFRPLHGDLVSFFQRSRREFFGEQGSAPDDRLWLVEFCRRCRDAERGSA
jgi:mxaA protein